LAPIIRVFSSISGRAHLALLQDVRLVGWKQNALHLSFFMGRWCWWPGEIVPVSNLKCITTGTAAGAQSKNLYRLSYEPLSELSSFPIVFFLFEDNLLPNIPILPFDHLPINSGAVGEVWFEPKPNLLNPSKSIYCQLRVLISQAQAMVIN